MIVRDFLLVVVMLYKLLLMFFIFLRRVYPETSTSDAKDFFVLSLTLCD